jgi:hypothetical protein
MYRARAAHLSWLLLPAVAAVAGAAQPPTPPAPTQSPFGDVSVSATPQRYQGRCPARIRFTARIAVNTHPMAFNYQFERSDGAKSQLRVVRVPKNGPSVYTVNEQWQLGAAGQHVQVWEKVKVGSGVTRLESNQASVDITCR